MKTLNLTAKFGLLTFTKTVLENCNPKLVLESDNIEELEEYHQDSCIESGAVGYTIIEKKENIITDYYSGEEFNMNSYQI